MEIINTFKQEKENGRIEEYEILKDIALNGTETVTIRLKTVESVKKEKSSKAKKS